MHVSSLEHKNISSEQVPTHEKKGEGWKVKDERWGMKAIWQVNHKVSHNAPYINTLQMLASQFTV